ncbi:aminopeptidase-like domain-containing protein [Parafrankia irregularis]|uniref:Aminopeptidase-like domain-containing protein n=1 Tax=Parafrankia irregularis TaxID=795642 RepID=A0A0S4QSX5_9ACTN|nr:MULTISPECIES: DUF4910 domain-containing protein [Parafrankia]MBE3205051.1 DUF4910 domain-containing protein [Parafrankia sp. CH37]CUU58727.1 aminopeptidase-like domain-containing protein [Parafrankia irregularis]
MSTTESDVVGHRLYDLVAALMPPMRSITGNGVRATLDLVRAALPAQVPLTVHEVPTGTPVLDWTIPREWNVAGARLIGPDGRVVLDAADNPLHLLGYSIPMRARMPLAELRHHLYSMPDRPDWVPYRTSYYNDAWGFCLTDRQLAALPDGEYQVEIDTSLTEGSLTYGEIVLPGTSDEEFLVTTHLCHPAMANDNSSGIAVAIELAAALAARTRRYTYRLLFIPGTIGSITWLALNPGVIGRIRHGLVLTGLGDRGAPTYKRSRRGDAIIDRATARALAETGRPHRIVDFSPYGYDERQFCSPGFDLPVGRFGRSQHGEYPEYHTSADNLEFVTPESLADSFSILRRTIEICEADRVWRNTSPYGEPQLGRRGLYRSIGATMNRASIEMGLLWVLNLADGTRGLLDIAERADLPFDAVANAADALAGVGLLVEEPSVAGASASLAAASLAGASAASVVIG